MSLYDKIQKCKAQQQKKKEDEEKCAKREADKDYPKLSKKIFDYINHIIDTDPDRCHLFLGLNQGESRFYIDLIIEKLKADEKFRGAHRL